MVGLVSCAPATMKRYEAQFITLFNTATRIIGYSESKEKFGKDIQSVHDEIEAYHQLYDIYNTYVGINNLKVVNDNAGKAPVKVDQRIIDLLLYSKEAYELTGGNVNVAFGAVLTIWHDYRTAGTDDPENAEVPPMELLLKASEHTDINDVIIDEESSTVFLKDPEMSLDVGAIAKGYATEAVSKLVEEKGVTSMLLSLGGNVRSIGVKADSLEPWVVGVQNPDTPDQINDLVQLNLTDMSLVTSGNYERFYFVDNKRYHHIINGDTLMPADFYAAVTILSNDSGLADALSTAIYNMPFEEGLQLIESQENTEAVWVYADGTLKYSSGFRSYIK